MSHLNSSDSTSVESEWIRDPPKSNVVFGATSGPEQIAFTGTSDDCYTILLAGLDGTVLLITFFLVD